MRDPLCRCPDDQGLFGGPGARNDDVNLIRIAAPALEREGLLLPDDAAIIVQSAAAERPLWGGAAP